MLDNTLFMNIKFPAYRHYELSLINANDSIMALLVSSHLSRTVLNRSPENKTLLPDLFENVTDIKRLNRTMSDAVDILSRSEYYLSAMALVYILAIHQSFMEDVVKLLQSQGYKVMALDSEMKPVKINASNVHGAIEACFGSKLDEELLKNLYFMRRIRNRIVHFGATPGDRLRKECKSMSSAEAKSWNQLTKRSMQELVLSDRLDLGSSEIIGALALSRRVAYNVQDLLRKNVDKGAWASIALEDCVSLNSLSFKDPVRRRAHFAGFVKQFYGGAQLGEEDLDAAMIFYFTNHAT